MADDFKCFLGEHSRFTFPDMRINYAPSDTPVSPDSDLKFRTYKKILTNSPACGIVIGRMEELRSFFYAQIYEKKKVRNNQRKFKWRWKSCAQELHWHVQNVSNVTTT